MSDHNFFFKKKEEREEKSRLLISCPSEVETQSWILTPRLALTLIPPRRLGFPGSLAVDNPPANTGDTRDVGLTPGLGRSTGKGTGNPLQYSCLENPMDRGAWWATAHGDRIGHN